MSANTLAPNGFQFSRLYGAGAPNYAMQTAQIAYNYGSKIGRGDPVYLNSSGQIALYAQGGTTIHGIFGGCNYLDPNLQRTQWYPAWNAPSGLASTTIVYAKVIVDPTAVFRAQMHGTAFTQADIGLNVDIYSGSSGAPNFAGISTCALNGTAASTNTLPFRIVDILQPPAITFLYNATYDNNWIEVTLNTSDITTRTGQA